MCRWLAMFFNLILLVGAFAETMQESLEEAASTLADSKLDDGVHFNLR